jgi:two-component system chemotaxis response regulator CheB
MKKTGTEFKRIIVIGASAGGFPVINEILTKLEEDLDAAVLIVLHLSKSSNPAAVVKTLQKNVSLVCEIAQDGLPLKKGHVYIAPPDLHLFVKDSKMFLLQGPHENRFRPAIDVLFRSAAVAYNSKIVGVVLSGLLDDGTSGMEAIKKCGGVTIVQEPAEAEFDDMPTNVLNRVDVDYRVPAGDISYVLHDICVKDAPSEIEPPDDVKIEVAMTEKMSSSLTGMPMIGNLSNYICPDCGGGLWEISREKNHRYRCHTGHVFTEMVLIEKQADAVEESLWVVIRLMEEQRVLLVSAAKHDQSNGMNLQAKQKENQAEHFKNQIDLLKNMLSETVVKAANK